MADRAKPSRILGIDFGLRRLGISLSDELKIIASPYQTLQAEGKSEETARKLIGMINELQEKKFCIIQEIIIGLPLMMSGKNGLLADEVKHFVAIVQSLTSIPIRLWDERLTTVQAERSLRESSLTRKRRSQVVDTVSAVIILQNYLDSINISKL